MPRGQPRGGSSQHHRPPVRSGPCHVHHAAPTRALAPRHKKNESDRWSCEGSVIIFCSLANGSSCCNRPVAACGRGRVLPGLFTEHPHVPTTTTPGSGHEPARTGELPLSRDGVERSDRFSVAYESAINGHLPVRGEHWRASGRWRERVACTARRGFGGPSACGHARGAPEGTCTVGTDSPALKRGA